MKNAAVLEDFKASKGSEISKSSERYHAACKGIVTPVMVEPPQKQLERFSFTNMRQRKNILETLESIRNSQKRFIQ
ncbi:MAG: hypothetical protein Kow002_13150 [Anaerolineales bacterium]